MRLLANRYTAQECGVNHLTRQYLSEGIIVRTWDRINSPSPEMPYIVTVIEINVKEEKNTG